MEIEDILEKEGAKKTDAATAKDVKKETTEPRVAEEKVGVKLQKIVIKKFTGDPVLWKEFEEIFDATVHSNSKLSDIEKFSYLKGYLGGAAERCIEGLPLTNGNYKEAWELLKERFGNPQLIIASHMHNLLKMEKVGSGRSCKGLRNLYDQVEGHVRALRSAGVTSEHYGAMLIPIIVERLPDDIKLEISRKLGTKVGKWRRLWTCWNVKLGLEKAVNL